MRTFNERALVYKLDKILKKEFGTNLSFQEFSAGYGIADLVFAYGFSFKKNLINRTPLTSFNELKVFLTLVENRDYNFEEIASLFPHSKENEIKKYLRSLVTNNYLAKVGRDIYIKTSFVSDLNPIKKIIAIEVKLNDHKGGLLQARRYQYFADESYLAILKEAEKNIDFEEFNKYNIGLILFDNHNNKIEIMRPEKENQKNDASINLFAKEMMLSRFSSFSS